VLGLDVFSLQHLQRHIKCTCLK